MENNTEIEKAVKAEISLAIESKAEFELIQRKAKMLSMSELAPKAFQGNIANCVIALQLAHRMNADEMMIMQNLDIIHGKPGFSSKFLIGAFNQCGRFSSIEYEEDENEGGRTRAKAINKDTGNYVFGPWVSMEMAKAEGWVNKNGSKWKTMPQLMRCYRAAAFFIRTTAPEITLGFPCSDELRDTEGHKSIRNATPQMRQIDSAPFDKFKQQQEQTQTVDEPASQETSLPLEEQPDIEF